MESDEMKNKCEWKRHFGLVKKTFEINEAENDQRGALDIGKQVRMQIAEILASPKKRKKRKTVSKILRYLGDI